MDAQEWGRWARRFETMYKPGDRGWFALFAPDAVYEGPHLGPIADMGAVHDATESMFARFGWQITSIRGTDSWAVFEYVFSGDYIGPGVTPPGVPVVAHGVCIIDVDAAGLITAMREYASPGEVEGQLARAGAGAGRPR
jgi:hypothetical protein